MPEDKDIQTAATITAKWWASYLREVESAFGTATKSLGEDGFVGKKTGRASEVMRRAQYRFLTAALASLNEERIVTFEEKLAHLIGLELREKPHHVSLAAHSQTHLGGMLEKALGEVGIRAYLTPGEPMFPAEMVTITDPRRVVAYDKDGTYYLLR